MTFRLHSFFFVDTCKDSRIERYCKGKQGLILPANPFSGNSFLGVTDRISNAI
jgi:hypothetical protein